MWGVREPLTGLVTVGQGPILRSFVAQGGVRCPPLPPRSSQGSEKEQPQESAPEEQWGTVLLHHGKAGAFRHRDSLPVLSIPCAQWSPCPSPNLARVLCSTLLQSSAMSWLFPISVGVTYSPGNVLPLGLHSDLDLWFLCLEELKKLTPSLSLQA